MKCYVCGDMFPGLDGPASDCPGICSKAECLRIVDDEVRWAEFLNVKEAFVVEKLREAGAGQLYVHLNPREPKGGA